MFATGGGLTVSMLPRVEAWLRVASLFVGLVIGILTCISLMRKLKQK